MARDIAIIEAEIDAAYKSKMDLDTTQMSNVTIFKQIRSIVALAANALEILFDKFKSDVDELANTVEFGTFSWWKRKMLEFQLNDVLVESNGKLYYLTVDATKQIINRCSIAEYDGILLIKIAHDNGTDLEIINDTEQRAAIDSYVNAIKPAGINTQIISNNPDKLNFTIEFVFDGKLIETSFKTTVEDAIKNFLKTLSSSDFDGLFKINKFRDSLESIPGMKDVFISSVNQQYPDEEDWHSLLLTSNYSAKSGYFVWDDASSHLTYTPQ
jgi:hypothetical protein